MLYHILPPTTTLQEHASDTEIDMEHFATNRRLCDTNNITWKHMCQKANT